MHLPPWQITLFYILTFASIGVMLWQISVPVRIWLGGKTIDWQVRPLLNISKYVLGQKKVQSNRKKSGAPMHLMIFYGFLALFVATTLLAINTYGPVKFHKGTYYLAYEMSADLLGAVFLIGLVWAFFRRLAFKPKTLIQAPNDFLTLGLLFTVGFTGFLLEAARMANDPKPFDWSAPVAHAMTPWLGSVGDQTYVGIWWFHMLWVWIFFATIPRMRLRHIVMAVLSIGGAPERPMGRLQPISMEDAEHTGQIGVSLAKDYSRWHLMSLDACMECGRCTEVCPANGVGKILDPRRVVQDIHRAGRTGEQVPLAVTEEALWACTTCHACVEACPVLIRHVDLIVDARRNLVAEGRLSGAAAGMLRQTGSTGNAWGAAASSREDWMKGLDVPLARDKKEFDVLFWVGCAGATDPGAVKTTRAMAELMSKAGVDYACLGSEETCTGDAARRVGDEFLFQEMAAANVANFKKYGVKKVVTPCPHCMNTLANEYGDFGADLEVIHHSQFLAKLIYDQKLVAASPASGELTYHDPCYLARVNNESDAPRSVLGDDTNLNSKAIPLVQWLEEGVEDRRLAEPEHFGRKTLCCGAGGGRMWMEEPVDQRPGNRRADELLATGAKSVAVGCPFCRIMLDASIKQVTNEDINLVDLAEVVRDANR